MITYINGKLVHKDPTHVIIDVQGIGYHIHISLTTYSHVKEVESCKLYTYLHIKEDAHTLYGFHNEAERKVFMSLISISGVGPSTGLMVQSSLSAVELKQAIVNEDVKTIQGVKGIGAKTAQRIILELKDKIKKEGIMEDGSTLSPKQHNSIKDEALIALTTLGISKAIAEKTVDSVLKRTKEEITLEELIKLALKQN